MKRSKGKRPSSTTNRWDAGNMTGGNGRRKERKEILEENIWRTFRSRFDSVNLRLKQERG